jgi:hypothetical protein
MTNVARRAFPSLTIVTLVAANEIDLIWGACELFTTRDQTSYRLSGAGLRNLTCSSLYSVVVTAGKQPDAVDREVDVAKLGGGFRWLTPLFGRAYISRRRSTC